MPTAKESAERLGVSKQTVIRWLQSGKLVGTLNESKRGAVWDVDEESVQRLIDDAEPYGSPEPNTKTETPTHAVVTALENNLDDLRQQLKEKEAQLDKRNEDIRELHRLLAQANNNVANLTPTLESKPEQRRPWWVFWKA